MLIVIVLCQYADCHYPLCHCDECCGTKETNLGGPKSKNPIKNKVLFHFVSLLSCEKHYFNCASGGTQTLELRIMSQVFDHWATWTQPSIKTLTVKNDQLRVPILALYAMCRAE